MDAVGPDDDKQVEQRQQQQKRQDIQDPMEGGTRIAGGQTEGEGRGEENTADVPTDDKGFDAKDSSDNGIHSAGAGSADGDENSVKQAESKDDGSGESQIDRGCKNNQGEETQTREDKQGGGYVQAESTDTDATRRPPAEAKETRAAGEEKSTTAAKALDGGGGDSPAAVGRRSSRDRIGTDFSEDSEDSRGGRDGDGMAAGVDDDEGARIMAQVRLWRYETILL